MESSSVVVVAVLVVVIALPLLAMAIRPWLRARAEARKTEAARRKAERDARAAAEARRKTQEKLDAIAPDVCRLYAEVAKLVAFESGYLMKKDWDALLAGASPTLKALSDIPIEDISELANIPIRDSAKLSDIPFQDMPSPSNIPFKDIDASTLATQAAFVRECCLSPSFRTRRNDAYKARELELCSKLFSDIDGGKSLDQQQRDAVVTDEYSNLVVAGAGSGKTSVVVGKVKYLVERWGVDPSQILVTSFTRASVDDLRARIEASGVRGVSARTFHSLGLRVLGSDFAVANENALARHVDSYLSNELALDPAQAAAFLEFFGLWSLTPGESPDSREAEERMKLLKAQDMRTLKGYIEESGREAGLDTLQGERVKSLEELMIANFLFLNGVEYEYEAPYPYDIPEELCDEGRRAYQPDFHLVDYDIWLEHFGIDENGRVPWLKTPVEEKAYLDGMQWKRQVHKACGTRLIESYSYWNKDQDLLNRLERLLVDSGVTLSIDPERNADLCGNLLRDQRFFSSMRQLVTTFVSLVKSSNVGEAEVDDKARVTYRGNGAMWHRYDLFTRFAWPIMRSYQRSLSQGEKPFSQGGKHFSEGEKHFSEGEKPFSEGEKPRPQGGKPMVDFDDMINRAAALIRENGYDETYRYIIVDEYQDISLSRFGLLSAIRDATGARLMCVGDDWQAIYRFAGSDVTLFTNFGRLAGHHEEMRIERTYRNSQELVDVASRFVLKNPDQLRKAVRSMAPGASRPPIAVISLLDQRAAFEFALRDLLSSADGGGEIKVLGRNRNDLKRIFPDLAPTGDFSFRKPRQGRAAEEKFDEVIVYRPAGRKPREIGYMTVHKSKGLQADNVIVIGLTNDRYGFPNMMADDPILELLLADSDRYDFAEERRLFYVALTRTKNRVWLVTGDDSGYPGVSTFVDELRRDGGDSVAFYDQVRYDQQAHGPAGRDAADGGQASRGQGAPGEAARCPRCGGVLVTRCGPRGEFVGCSNYPFCTKTYRDVRILTDRKQCPQCGGWLTRRKGKDGREFFGCTNYPRYCHYTVGLEYESEGASRAARAARAAQPARQRRSAWHTRTTEPPDTRTNKKDWHPSSSKPDGQDQGETPLCPECGAPMALRSGPYGQFYGCTNYPSCRGKRDYGSRGARGNRGGSTDKSRHRQPKDDGRAPTCPKCGARMVLRTSKYGKFYGCSRYPSCKGKRDYRA